MRQFTALGITHASVAEVGTFENMAVGAACTLLAVAIEAKFSADRGSWRHLCVSEFAVRFGATVLNKVQARGGAFRGEFVRKIARVTVDAFFLLKKVLANSNLGWVVDISAPRTFGA